MKALNRGNAMQNSGCGKDVRRRMTFWAKKRKFSIIGDPALTTRGRSEKVRAKSDEISFRSSACFVSFSVCLFVFQCTLRPCTASSPAQHQVQPSNFHFKIKEVNLELNQSSISHNHNSPENSRIYPTRINFAKTPAEPRPTPTPTPPQSR